MIYALFTIRKEWVKPISNNPTASTDNYWLGPFEDVATAKEHAEAHIDTLLIPRAKVKSSMHGLRFASPILSKPLEKGS